MKYIVTTHVHVGNNHQKLMDTCTLISWVSENWFSLIKIKSFGGICWKKLAVLFGANLSQASTLATNQGAVHHSLMLSGLSDE